MTGAKKPCERSGFCDHSGQSLAQKQIVKARRIVIKAPMRGVTAARERESGGTVADSLILFGGTWGNQREGKFR